MKNVFCLRHPKYDGKGNPDLRCKVCCSLFVDQIKTNQSKRAENVAAWLEGKSQREKKHATKKS